MKLPILKLIVLAVALIGLTACANKRGGRGGNDEMGIGDSARFYGMEITPEQKRQLLAQKTYYFGYDSFDVNDDDMLSIYAHAERLITSSNRHIRVEGHTDERGSREYNVALGERRANAVANVLMMKGVRQDQITVVSYGKEKPAEFGSGESAWAKNRRAVIVYEVE